MNIHKILDTISNPQHIPQKLYNKLIFVKLGKTHYSATLKAMQDYSSKRQSHHPSQIWITQHHSVYTKGLSSKKEHVLQPLRHPIVETDRGGQITYHGPGQLVVYFLLNLKTLKTTKPGEIVNIIEKIILKTLEKQGIKAYNNTKARGIYFKKSKIASIGLRIKKSYLYHGFALNIDMDLKPFTAIHPCGEKQEMTQIKDHASANCNFNKIIEDVITNIKHLLALDENIYIIDVESLYTEKDNALW